MIDMSSVKASGWQRVVAELAAPVGDDRAFLARLLSILGQVSSAKQAVLFGLSVRPNDAVEGGSAGSGPSSSVEHRAAMIWMAGGATTPGGLDTQVNDEGSIEFLGEVKNAAQSVTASRALGVFGIEKSDLMYAEQQGTVVAIPIMGGAPGEQGAGEVRAVITLLLEARSRQALQTTLALIEVLAGYCFLHNANQNLRRTRQASASLDLAARLIAAINGASNYKGAKLQFVNDLSRHVRAERVSLGWVMGGAKPRGKVYCRVVAMSDTENVDRRMVAVQKIEAAMDECMDQGQPVLYPLPAPQGDEADFLLNQAIVHAHRELASRDARLKIASLPMRVNERIVGVLTIETAQDEPLSIQTLELLQATMDLTAPVLEIRRSDDLPLVARAADDLVKLGEWVVGPKHTVWKLAGVAASVALILAAVIPLPYRVGAEMELQPRNPRTISAPFEGIIKTLPEGSKPGERVAIGQTLVEMDTTEIQLQRLDALAQITQAEKQADEARRKGEMSQAQQYQARAEQSKARVQLYDNRIEQAKLLSPVNGLIIAGDLRDRVGASVPTGQQLYQIADVTDMLVIAKVDDRDISLIQVGQTGEVTTKSDPSRAFQFTVERIVPLSEAKEGVNTYEVRCKLEAGAPGLRPGMQGQAKFNVGKKSLLAIASRRIVDQLRLWLWW